MVEEDFWLVEIMTLLVPTAPAIRSVNRSMLARQRAQKATAMLADCRLCAHDCGVNRLAGETGFCHTGATARCFSAQTEVADELELIPTFAIAFSGCDFRCDFCITGAESWNPTAGARLDAQALAVRTSRALERGARTVMFLGGEPTIHLPSVLEVVARLPANAKLVWKTNAHASAQARVLLEGIFDVWVADFKFGNPSCAERLAKVRDYLGVVQANLLWAAGQCDLIVRHVLMPGHIDCCWNNIAEWLAAELPQVRVSLRDGFWPGWHSHRHPELRNTLNATEARRARDIAAEVGLKLVP
jgi:putative pyruvate formate lyase activating enzyme